MNLKIKIIIVLISAISFSYGVALQKFKVFPYSYLVSIKHAFNNKIEKDINHRNKEYLINQFEIFSREVDVVVIGDSITAGGIWSDIFPNIQIANRGVGADTTFDILLRIDSITSTKPKVAFISVGVNDLNQKVPISAILNNYELIITHLLDNGIDVIAQSTIQCNCKVANKINILNIEIQKLANKKKITYLDLGELALEDGLDPKYTYDGIHLTGKGYKYWHNRMLSIIRNYEF